MRKDQRGTQAKKRSVTKMIRAPPDHRRKEKEMAQKLYEVFIIRWSDAIKWPDGVVSNMSCHSGPIEEARRYAEEIAEKYGVTVEVIA